MVRRDPQAAVARAGHSVDELVPVSFQAHGIGHLVEVVRGIQHEETGHAHDPDVAAGIGGELVNAVHHQAVGILMQPQVILFFIVIHQSVAAGAAIEGADAEPGPSVLAGGDGIDHRLPEGRVIGQARVWVYLEGSRFWVVPVYIVHAADPDIAVPVLIKLCRQDRPDGGGIVRDRVEAGVFIPVELHQAALGGDPKDPLLVADDVMDHVAVQFGEMTELGGVELRPESCCGDDNRCQKQDYKESLQPGFFRT